MIIKGHKKSESKIDLDKILRSYDKAVEDKALLKSYLKYFLLKYDKFCGIFYYFYRDLLDILNLFDMHKKVFVKKL